MADQAHFSGGGASDGQDSLLGSAGWACRNDAYGHDAFVDSYLLEINVLQEAERMGMRCAGGEVLFAFPSPAYDGWNGAEALVPRAGRRFGGCGRVQLAVMPHSVYTTSDDVLRRSMQLAEELDLMLHIHLSESAGEVGQCRSLHQDREACGLCP